VNLVKMLQEKQMLKHICNIKVKKNTGLTPLTIDLLSCEFDLEGLPGTEESFLVPG
jgi:hypothetical protein